MTPWSDKLSSAADTTMAAGVVLLLVLPPIFFGAVEPVPEAALMIACYALGFLLVCRMTVWRECYVRTLESRSYWRRVPPSLVALAALILVFGWLLTIPVPRIIHGMLSPASLELYRQAAEVVAPMKAPESFPISLYRFGSVEALLKLVAYFSFFFAALGGFLDWKRTRRAAAVFITTVFGVSILGIIQTLAVNQRILWAGRIAERARPFGPFVNRNHFAAWAGMGVLLGIGYFFSMGHRKERVNSRTATTIEDKNLSAKRALVGFITAVSAAAVFLSLSRGGVLSMIIGMVTVSILMATRRRLGRAWRMPIMLFLALLVVVWMGADPVIRRMETVFHVAESARVRVDLNRDLLGMARKYPWTGTGPGTFGTVYPIYQTANWTRKYTYAHNDYLQMLVEWGGIGAALFMAAGIMFWWRFWKMWSRRRDRETLYLSAGAAGAVVVMMAHSFVDFNLHIPSNAVAFMFVAALALKTAGTKKRGSGLEMPHFNDMENKPLEKEKEDSYQGYEKTGTSYNGNHEIPSFDGYEDWNTDKADDKID